MKDLFSDDKVNLDVLKKRAVGLRWAGVPEGVIPLTAADPDFVPAREINEAMIEFIKGGYFPYAPAAIDGLREAIVRSICERNGFEVPVDCVLPVDSAATAMQAIAVSILRPGDEAIIFDPVDLLFGISVRYAGAQVVYYPSKYDYDAGRWDFSDLERYITPKTKMICLCNPHNPMGLLYTQDELRQIAELADRHGLWILNDEIWKDITYEKPFVSINSLGPELNRRTVSCYGLSKGFGIPGLRAGYLYALDRAAYQKVADVMNGPFGGVDYVTQVAMLTAFEKCYYWVDAFRAHLQGNRDYLFQRLSAMPGIRARCQQATFVSFPDISATGLTSAEFRDFMLREQKVDTVPGTVKWFGPRAEGHVRLCYATSRGILTEALDRFEAGMHRLMNR